MIAAVSLRDVSCVFATSGKNVHAVVEVNLEVFPGEFFTLLGPSGSGKTTCLRMIGGFTLPSKGQICIEGQDVSRLPPYSRPVNTVFQDYALFPHMTVLENVAYGMMVRGVDKYNREKKALLLLETVQLPDVANRKPSQLSGGQRQRVALARALVNEPKVLLLDEPLGALDLKLREQMQAELKSLQRKLGITFIFVTHDQHEALSMSDRIGVFSQGRFLQVATPDDLYNRPSNHFVADFVGAANLLQGSDAQLYSPDQAVMIRPEHIRIEIGDGNLQATPQSVGTVLTLRYFGSFWRLYVQADTGPNPLIVDLPVQVWPKAPPTGTRVRLFWDRTAVHAIEQNV
ncbi:MAG: ABC transporter ATP-binding protein [Limnohabitans sp.]